MADYKDPDWVEKEQRRRSLERDAMDQANLHSLLRILGSINHLRGENERLKAENAKLKHEADGLRDKLVYHKLEPPFEQMGG